MPAIRMPESWNGTIGARRERSALRGRTVAGSQPGQWRRDEAPRVAARADKVTGGAHHRPTARLGARLTGRGGMGVVFTASFVGVLAAEESHVAALAGLCYVGVCVLVACAVRRNQLLPVTVTPPMLFGGALICVQLITARGGVLAIAEGTVVSLGNAAPWLFAGTALGLVAALARGLTANVRALRDGLRGDPADGTLPPGAGSP